MSDELLLGQLVYSKAGRDKGKAFLVTSIADDSFVYLVDGEMRRLEKPKRKNVKHLHNTGIIAESIAHKLAKGETISNSEIKLTIALLIGEKADSVMQGG